MSDLVESPSTPAVPDEVADAIRTLIRWAGDDPTREGLADIDTARPATDP